MYCPAETPEIGPGKDVVEHQRGDAQLGEGSAQRLLHDAVDAPAGKHGAALDVDRSHCKGEKHDPENEPGGGLANGFFRDAAGIKSGRA